MRAITVLLADDQLVVRAGLRTLVEAEGDIKVIGEASDGDAAVRLAKSLHPAVIVMDIAMPRLNGFEATRLILNADPAAKVLILSMHRDIEYVKRAMAEGAMGYLVKEEAGKALAPAIRAASKGDTFFGDSVRARLHDSDGGPPCI